ncbi:MAG: stage II sporulation protein R [Ruminococcaceae bacterium]|nr:stage II sporulation protein R [Oscillospiraceae bacterium]
MKKINFFKAGIVIFGIILVFSIITYAKNTQKNIADSVLRLHVIANSNSKDDQELKLKVRDRLLSEGMNFFNKNMSLEDTKKYIIENNDEIRKIAEDEIRRNGYDYKVEIMVGEFAFPAKYYESIMLPSGKYDAVRVIIGEGKGENWWCVMYPPMCALDGITVKNGKNQLKKSLSGEEYRLISKKNPPTEIRFKIVDFINSVF